MRRRLHIVAQVAVHESGVVSLVSWAAMQLTVGIMHREVERRAANQRRQPRHWLLAPAMTLVEPLEPAPQHRLLKVVAQFKRMTPRTYARPQLR